MGVQGVFKGCFAQWFNGCQIQCPKSGQKQCLKRVSNHCILYNTVYRPVQGLYRAYTGLYCTVQYSTGTIQYCTELYTRVQVDSVVNQFVFNTVQYCTTLYCTVQYTCRGIRGFQAQYSTVWYSTVLYTTLYTLFQPPYSRRHHHDHVDGSVVVTIEAATMAVPYLYSIAQPLYCTVQYTCRGIGWFQGVSHKGLKTGGSGYYPKPLLV